MCSTHHFLYFGSTQPGDVLDPPSDRRDSLFLGVIPGAFLSLSFCSWLKWLLVLLDDDCCPFLSVEEGIFGLCFTGSADRGCEASYRLLLLFSGSQTNGIFKMLERLPMMWWMKPS